MPATYVRVPSAMSSERLVEVLEKVLPSVLIRELKLTPHKAGALAPRLAREIVAKAEACSATHVINDTSTIQLGMGRSGLTKEECDAFRAELEKLVVIRYVDKPETGPMDAVGRAVRSLAGRVWARLEETFAPDLWEREQKSGGGGGGIRG